MAQEPTGVGAVDARTLGLFVAARIKAEVSWARRPLTGAEGCDWVWERAMAQAHRRHSQYFCYEPKSARAGPCCMAWSCICVLRAACRVLEEGDFRCAWQQELQIKHMQKQPPTAYGCAHVGQRIVVSLTHGVHCGVSKLVIWLKARISFRFHLTLNL